MLAALGKLYLMLTGWQVVGSVPDLPKFVVVAAPHTSNWDFPTLLAVKWVLGIDVAFLAKDSLFRGPGKFFFERLGGIPVERSSSHDLVRQVVQRFAQADRLIFVVAPEGTRSYAPHWRSGFYRIALEAGVPVVLAFIDYRTKQAGIGPTIDLSGDEEEDMARIAEFYADKHGVSPERSGPIRLADGH